MSDLFFILCFSVFNNILSLFHEYTFLRSLKMFESFIYF